MRLFGDQRPVAHGQPLLRLVDIDVGTLHGSFRVNPRHAPPARRRACQGRVIQDCPPILSRRDDGFHMDERTAGIEGEYQFAAERPNRQITDGDTCAAAGARDLDLAQVQA